MNHDVLSQLTQISKYAKPLRYPAYVVRISWRYGFDANRDTSMVNLTIRRLQEVSDALGWPHQILDFASDGQEADVLFESSESRRNTLDRLEAALGNVMKVSYLVEVAQPAEKTHGQMEDTLKDLQESSDD